MSLFGPAGTRGELADNGSPEPAREGLYVRLLGRFGLHVDGAPLSLRGERRRALLATLLLNAGRTVSTASLIARVWHEPGPAARGALQVHVARVRALLAQTLGHPLIHSSDGGYRIELDDHRSDLLTLRSLVREADLAADRGDTDAHADLLGEALSLWRGPVLADIDSPLLREHDVPPLHEELLRVAETGFGAALARGEHERVATRIASITADHPQREPLVRVQMIALYRCGRRSEALRVYSRTRAALAQALGVDPGRELQDTFHGVLRGDLDDRPEHGPLPAGALRGGDGVPRSVVPRQRSHRDVHARTVRGGGRGRRGLVPAELPAAPRGLIGRADALAELDRLVDPCSTTPGSVLVRGPAGAGGSALALYWAYSVTSHFPDGQLYVNLRDADGEPREPGEVVRRLVRSLSVGAVGTGPSDIGADEPEEAAARLRSLLAGRRVLVVLDNAATARQVRPLLPGGPGSAAVVTSRNWLTDLLVRDGLRALPVGALETEDAVALLRSLLGTDRHRGETLRRVAELAGRLPLSLRMAVAWLDAHPERDAEELVRLVERVDPARGVSPTARMAAVLRAGPLGSGTAAGKYRSGAEHPT
ncbi:AfsR/SARP family transcriptional regulator [Nocardiopsis alba]|uniref:AfsR/SARP family transcriptional regulator n=1 Tax=Nocardiopsis alba TaxID=53437 RepID=A0ABV5DTP0_9ACTN